MKEHHFYCPHCHAGNVAIIDTNTSAKEIVVDCDVCSHPVLLNYQIDFEKQLNFTADFAEAQFALA